MLSGAQFTSSQFILYLSAHYRKLKDIELFADSIRFTHNYRLHCKSSA
jgi:hypothetical protein